MQEETLELYDELNNALETLAFLDEMIGPVDGESDNDREIEKKIFGYPLSKAEVRVVYDPRLTVADKIVKLTVLRGERTAIPRSFNKRITKADAFHARALGIRL
jgi:hypothetical protein